jgi:hypothetical protein
MLKPNIKMLSMKLIEQRTLLNNMEDIYNQRLRIACLTKLISNNCSANYSKDGAKDKSRKVAGCDNVKEYTEEANDWVNNKINKLPGKEDLKE